MPDEALVAPLLTREQIDEIRDRNDGASGAVNRLLEHVESQARVIGAQATEAEYLRGRAQELTRLQYQVALLPIELVAGFLVPRKGAGLPADAAPLVVELLVAALAEREARARLQPGMLTVYLAGRRAESAHLALACRHLADRPDRCADPRTRTARPAPDREGWVEFEVHDGTRRRGTRQVKLCADCVGERARP